MTVDLSAFTIAKLERRIAEQTAAIGRLEQSIATLTAERDRLQAQVAELGVWRRLAALRTKRHGGLAPDAALLEVARLEQQVGVGEKRLDRGDPLAALRAAIEEGTDG